MGAWSNAESLLRIGANHRGRGLHCGWARKLERRCLAGDGGSGCVLTGKGTGDLFHLERRAEEVGVMTGEVVSEVSSCPCLHP